MNTTNKKVTSLTLAVLVLLSVFAAAVPGTVAAAPEDYEFDTELEDDELYWQGQTLYRSANVTTGSTYEVVGTDEGNDYFRQISAEGEGEFVINTEAMPSGSYSVELDSGTVVTFDVREQSLSASAEADSENANQHAVAFDSNRAAFQVVVESEGLSAEELDSIFANGAVNDGEYVMDVRNSGDFAMAFDESIEEGSYDFTFTVVDTGVSDTVEGVTVGEPADANAEFSESIYTGVEGDIAEFTVELEEAETANVHFGSEDMNYEHEFDVTDGNGDGEVTVRFDTRAAGNAETTVTAADSEDSVTPVGDETELAEPLSTGTYDLRVFIGDEERDISALDISERSTQGINTYIAPGSASMDSVDEIVAAATPSDTVATGDKFVVEVNTNGIYSHLTEDSTAADLNAGNGNGFHVALEEQADRPNYQPRTISADEGTLFVDEENESFYLVYDVDALGLEDGAEYEANYVMTEENAYIEDEEAAEANSASTSLSVVDRVVNFNGWDDAEEFVEVRAEDSHAVTGDTTVAPGTEITVVARSTGDAPFLMTSTVEVTEEQTFEALFDFSSLSEGHEFTLETRNYETVNAVAVEERDPEVITIESQVSDEGSEIVVSDVNLHEAGTISLYNADGDLIGESDELEAGSHTGVSVALNESLAPGDHEVTAEAGNVSDTATVTVPDAEETAEHTLTVEAVDENGEAVEADLTLNGESIDAGDHTLEEGEYTVEASAEGYENASQTVTLDSDKTVTLTLSEEQDDSNASDEPAEEPGSGSEDQPGFGIMVALVALLAAAGIALNRRD